MSDGSCAELAAGSAAAGDKAPKRKIKVEVPKWCGQWVVSMDAFQEGVVGAKSKNIAGAGFGGGALSVPEALAAWPTMCPRWERLRPSKAVTGAPPMRLL